MNRRDIVYAALNHEETKPVPYHIEFTGESLKKMVLATGKTAAEVEESVGSYLNYIQYWGWPTELPDRAGYFRDEFGVVWNRNGPEKDIGWAEDPLITDIETGDYRFPEPDIPRLRRDIEGLLAEGGDRFTFMGFGFCMFERAWSLMGMENVLTTMVTSPGELEKLFDRICDFFIRLVDVALEYEALDGIYFGDDWGQQRGLIMGLTHWRRFIKPRMARLYARVKSGGKFVIQHSCGDCNEILPELIEIGLDCYQTFQPEIYDIAGIKRKYGDRLSFWGAVSTQQVLPAFTPEQVRKEIVRVGNILRPGGGFIIAPTHALPSDIPVENIQAMIEVFQNQERFFD
ncbi:MAG: uroporphyrinogen decarboxylase [Treponema sp.]|jgi:uroporphyrinogen decarboxylase|nr:uroporphyrinogen decarboxylase [Treponema sp.]